MAKAGQFGAVALAVSVNRPLQLLGFVLLGMALLWPVVGDRVQAALTPDQEGCADTSALPSPDGLDEMREAVLCLLNAHRDDFGLPPLRERLRLQVAAQRHAVDMGQRDFFAHRNPDGISPHERIRATGYQRATTGENIAWGGGVKATPGEIVRSWMNSPGHRANILRAAFSEIGTGIAIDAPEPLARDAAIYVNNFGG